MPETADIGNQASLRDLVLASSQELPSHNPITPFVKLALFSLEEEETTTNRVGDYLREQLGLDIKDTEIKHLSEAGKIDHVSITDNEIVIDDKFEQKYRGQRNNFEARTNQFINNCAERLSHKYDIAESDAIVVSQQALEFFLELCDNYTSSAIALVTEDADPADIIDEYDDICSYEHAQKIAFIYDSLDQSDVEHLNRLLDSYLNFYEVSINPSDRDTLSKLVHKIRIYLDTPILYYYVGIGDPTVCSEVRSIIELVSKTNARLIVLEDTWDEFRTSLDNKRQNLQAFYEKLRSSKVGVDQWLSSEDEHVMRDFRNNFVSNQYSPEQYVDSKLKTLQEAFDNNVLNLHQRGSTNSYPEEIDQLEKVSEHAELIARFRKSIGEEENVDLKRTTAWHDSILLSVCELERSDKEYNHFRETRSIVLTQSYALQRADSIVNSSNSVPCVIDINKFMFIFYPIVREEATGSFSRSIIEELPIYGDLKRSIAVLEAISKAEQKIKSIDNEVLLDIYNMSGIDHRLLEVDEDEREEQVIDIYESEAKKKYRQEISEKEAEIQEVREKVEEEKSQRIEAETEYEQTVAALAETNDKLKNRLDETLEKFEDTQEQHKQELKRRDRRFEVFAAFIMSSIASLALYLIAFGLIDLVHYIVLQFLIIAAAVYYLFPAYRRAIAWWTAVPAGLISLIRFFTSS